MKDEAQRGCDRRILRAFYTQYVAVLLIMLVFAVGAFQQRAAGGVHQTNQGVGIPVVAPIGSVIVTNPFNDRGELIHGHESLIAISHMLQEHDLRAVVTVTLSAWNHVSVRDELQDVVHRIRVLEAFFSERGVTPGVVTFVVEDEIQKTDHLKVDFTRGEHDTFLL